MIDFIKFMSDWISKNKDIAKFMRSATLEDNGSLKYIFSIYEENIVLQLEPKEHGAVSFHISNLDEAHRFNDPSKDEPEKSRKTVDVQSGAALRAPQVTSEYSDVIKALVNQLIEHLTQYNSEPSLATSRMIYNKVLGAVPIKVMDIGASPINEPPYLDLKNIGLVDVIGFEPNPNEHEKLKRTNGDFYYKSAVGDGKSYDLKITKSPGFTSIYEIDLEKIEYLNRWHDEVKIEKSVLVDTVRLSDLPDMPNIDLLKMDIQGAEGLALEYGQNVLKTAVCVIVEVSLLNLYKSPASRFSSIHDTLLNSGFIFHKFSFLKSHVLRPLSKRYENINFHPSQVIDGDAIYIKDLSRTESLDLLALGRLALISDGVIKSPDLALRCLELISANSVSLSLVGDEYVRLYQAWSKR